jgi:hypothetical protein
MTPLADQFEALKPCPWCAGPVHIIPSDPYYPRFVKTWRPQCQKCGANLGELDTQAEAIAAWNNRTAISSALTSAPPVQEGWRGIETAPRDGTFFDAWMRNPEFPDGYRLPSCSFSMDKGEFVDAHGMFLHVAGDPVSGKWRIYPTHWRPLPAAPEPTPTGEMG